MGGLLLWQPWYSWEDGPAQRGVYNERTATALKIREEARDIYIKNLKAWDELQKDRFYNGITTQDRKEKALQEERRRVLSGPPTSEITSGRTLNFLLTDTQRLLARGQSGSPIPVDEDLLGRINVIPTSNTSNNLPYKVTFLKEQRLHWPAFLERPEFAKDREQLIKLSADVVKQLGHSHPLPETQTAMKKTVDRLWERFESLEANHSEMRETMTARAFLRSYRDAVTALKHAEVRAYFMGTVLQARTVDGLVKYMTENGLQFAAASRGDEGQYQALYWAMAAYDISGQVSSPDRSVAKGR